jgi:hypothetical protein
MFLGCTESNSDIDYTNKTLTNVTNVPETVNLEIKSFSTSSESLRSLSGTARIKNIGNITANDVYFGIAEITMCTKMQLYFDGPLFRNTADSINFSTIDALLPQAIEDETSIIYIENNETTFLKPSISAHIDKYYIGTIEPQETITTENIEVFFDYNDYGYCSSIQYIKFVWIEDNGQITIYDVW